MTARRSIIFALGLLHVQDTRLQRSCLPEPCAKVFNITQLSRQWQQLQPVFLVVCCWQAAPGPPPGCDLAGCIAWWRCRCASLPRSPSGNQLDNGNIVLLSNLGKRQHIVSWFARSLV